MDSQYLDIYQMLWRRAQTVRGETFYWPTEEEWLSYGLSLRAVEAALERFQDVEVRDDAKLFLAINIHSLVVLPQLIKAERDGSLRSSSRELLDNVTKDVTSTLSAASEEARDGEISSAAIIRGLSQVLDRLKLKDARIWSGPEEDRGVGSEHK